MPSPLFTHVQKNYYYEWHRSSLVINRQSGHQDIRTSIIVIIYAVADRLFSFLFFYLLLALLSALITFDFGVVIDIDIFPFFVFFPSLSLPTLPRYTTQRHTAFDTRHSTFNRYSIASRHAGQGIDVPCQILVFTEETNVKVKSEGISSFLPSSLLLSRIYDLWFTSSFWTPFFSRWWW